MIQEKLNIDSVCAKLPLMPTGQVKSGLDLVPKFFLSQVVFATYLVPKFFLSLEVFSTDLGGNKVRTRIRPSMHH